MKKIIFKFFVLLNLILAKPIYNGASMQPIFDPTYDQVMFQKYTKTHSSILGNLGFNLNIGTTNIFKKNTIDLTNYNVTITQYQNKINELKESDNPLVFIDINSYQKKLDSIQNEQNQLQSISEGTNQIYSIFCPVAQIYIKNLFINMNIIGASNLQLRSFLPPISDEDKNSQFYSQTYSFTFFFDFEFQISSLIVHLIQKFNLSFIKIFTIPYINIQFCFPFIKDEKWQFYPKADQNRINIFSLLWNFSTQNKENLEKILPKYSAPEKLSVLYCSISYGYNIIDNFITNLVLKIFPSQIQASLAFIYLLVDQFFLREWLINKVNSGIQFGFNQTSLSEDNKKEYTNLILILFSFLFYTAKASCKISHEGNLLAISNGSYYPFATFLPKTSYHDGYTYYHK